MYMRFGGEKRPAVAGVVFSLVEGCGPAAVPSLVRLLDQARTGDSYPSSDDRRACAEALALLPDSEAFEALAGRLDLKEVTVAAGECIGRHPRIALPALAARGGPGAEGAAAALLSALARGQRRLDRRAAARPSRSLPAGGGVGTGPRR